MSDEFCIVVLSKRYRIGLKRSDASISVDVGLPRRLLFEPFGFNQCIIQSVAEGIHWIARVLTPGKHLAPRTNRWSRACVGGNTHSLRVSIRVNYYVRGSIRNANICRSWGGSRNPHLHEYRWDICTCIRWRDDDRFWREVRIEAASLRYANVCCDTSRFINLKWHRRHCRSTESRKRILSKATKWLLYVTADTRERHPSFFITNR